MHFQLFVVFLGIFGTFGKELGCQLSLSCLTCLARNCSFSSVQGFSVGMCLDDDVLDKWKVKFTYTVRGCKRYYENKGNALQSEISDATQRTVESLQNADQLSETTDINPTIISATSTETQPTSTSTTEVTQSFTAQEMQDKSLLRLVLSLCRSLELITKLQTKKHYMKLEDVGDELERLLKDADCTFIRSLRNPIKKAPKKRNLHTKTTFSLCRSYVYSQKYWKETGDDQFQPLAKIISEKRRIKNCHA